MSNTYYQGQSVTFTCKVTSGGGPQNVTTCTFNLRDPRGNVTQYASPTNPATGTYQQVVTLASNAPLGDNWNYYWATTGPAEGQMGLSLPVASFAVAAGAPF